jgi:rubrerythrin
MHPVRRRDGCRRNDGQFDTNGLSPGDSREFTFEQAGAPRRQCVQIDKRRLSELSDEVDQLHHESMRTLREEYAEIHFGEVVPGHRATRRGFLTKAATGGALLTVGSLVAPLGSLVPAAFAQSASSDAELAAFAAGLELAAVEVYRAANASGKLRNSATDVATMFGGHHQQHADALNAILGEEEAVTEANKALVAQFAPAIRDAADEAAVLEIAYSVEEAAASTYLMAIGELEDASNAAALATILPVESQHATVLGAMLDKDPSDYLIEFLTTDAAVDPADYPAS